MNILQEKTLNKFKEDNRKRYKEIRHYIFNTHISIYASIHSNMEGSEVAHVLPDGNLKLL